MNLFIDAFFRIPQQWLGFSFVLGTATFFGLWMGYGLLLKWTSFFPRWWGVPSEMEVGGFGKSSMTLKFRTSPIWKKRFRSCQVFLCIHSGDVTHTLVKTPIHYRHGRRTSGGEEVVETWKNLEQVKYQLHLDEWKPGEPLQGAFRVPQRALTPGTSEKPAVNLAELLIRHPIFGEEKFELPLDFSVPLLLSGPETKKTEVAEIPWGGDYWNPWQRSRTFLVLFLVSCFVMLIPLGFNIGVQRHLGFQETQVMEAYQQLGRGDLESVTRTVENITPIPPALRTLAPYHIDNLNAEISGFHLYLNQRKGTYSSTEPELGTITPPIQWMARAEFFLHQGNPTQAGSQLESLLSNHETQSFAFPFTLNLLDQLEKAGDIDKAKELGAVVLKRLNDGNATPKNNPACQALYEKLSGWFPEDPNSPKQ